jgi:hypothetical protein
MATRWIPTAANAWIANAHSVQSSRCQDLRLLHILAFTRLSAGFAVAVAAALAAAGCQPEADRAPEAGGPPPRQNGGWTGGGDPATPGGERVGEDVRRIDPAAPAQTPR